MQSCLQWQLSGCPHFLCFMMFIVTRRFCVCVRVISVREDNDSNVYVVITWFIWTLMSLKSIESNHLLTVVYCSVELWNGENIKQLNHDPVNNLMFLSFTFH